MFEELNGAASCRTCVIASAWTRETIIDERVSNPLLCLERQAHLKLMEAPRADRSERMSEPLVYNSRPSDGRDMPADKVFTMKAVFLRSARRGGAPQATEFIPPSTWSAERCYSASPGDGWAFPKAAGASPFREKREPVHRDSPRGACTAARARAFGQRSGSCRGRLDW